MKTLVFTALLVGFSQIAIAMELPQRNLDGVPIEAVESYPGTKEHEAFVGLQDYPFNAYYHGFGINAGYTYHFNNTHAWEMINATYFMTFDKALTTQLADRNRLQPEQVNRINYLVTSNGVYDLAKGKFVMLKEHIRYFSASLVYGVGAIKTKSDTNFATNFGARFSVLLNNQFLWSIDLRDAIALPGFTNYITFGLIGGYTF